jgi:alpha-L-fucosidase
MDRRTFIKAAGAGAGMMALRDELLAGIPGESREERDRRMAWWREARFGMFIHWGLYSIPAGVWKGKQEKGKPAEWIMNAFQIPDAEYSQLAKQFNPIKFEAKVWARIAKNAGMKYLVITSKHHDGFCMFDTKLSNYNVVAGTPFQRDVIAELAQACADEGIRFGVYYSQLDWHHARSPGAMARIPDFPQYLEYLKGQLRELLTRYGPLGSLFFDGDWMPQWTNRWGREVETLCRQLQPQVVINDRIGKRPLVKNLGALLKIPQAVATPAVGDYATPEQEIPPRLPRCDWETCMTMNDSWGYKSFDQNWKSPTALLRNLIDIASKGGNFLLNVGPTSEGLIPEPSVERLGEIGKWMEKNGESIYGSSAGPLQKLSWGRTTQKPGKIYVHVFDWPSGDLRVSGIKQKVQAAYLLEDSTQSPLPLKSANGDLIIQVSAPAPNSISSVVVLAV